MSQDLEKMTYEYALTRVEALLPLVGKNTPANDPAAAELALLSDFVVSYELDHYPFGKPTMAELIQLSLAEKGLVPSCC